VGGVAPISTILTVSGGGFLTRVFTPAISSALLSLEDTANCAKEFCMKGNASSSGKLSKDKQGLNFKIHLLRYVWILSELVGINNFSEI
jgi:hypothetical protein